jgi:competence protein ComFC
MFRAITNILFPKYCLLCSKPNETICDYCCKKFIPSIPECYKCRRLSPGYITHTHCKKIYSLDTVFWAWRYTKESSTIIKTLKYKGAFDIQEDIGEFFVKRIEETNFLKQFNSPIMIPLPIHKSKELDRGFNQSNVIGEYISKKLDIPFDSFLLSRIKRGKAQAKRNICERRLMDVDTFHFDMNTYLKNYKGSDVLIVDDVITTGTTLNIACRCIKEKKKSISVSAICLFRGKPNYSVSTFVPDSLS